MLNAKNENVYSIVILVVFLVLQILLLKQFSFIRNDEIQALINYSNIDGSIFQLLILGLIKINTGGQAFTHFIFAVYSRISENIVFLKILPFIFSVLSLPLMMSFFKSLKLKNSLLVTTLIAFHPSFLFYASDFKQYSSDIFFMFLFLFLFVL